jgi:WD40 repeat protein
VGAPRAGKGQRMRARQNPYIGPRSFRTGEKLFGRAPETAELIDLLIAERIVLMSSPSGAGKSSLINARVVPLMRERGFTVFPPMRVSRSLPSDVVVGPDANRFVVSLLLSLEESQGREYLLPLDTLMRITFEDYLARRTPIDTSSDSILFVFDQFEEILTIDPNQRAAKQEFFDQVGRALRARTRWALFATREEYVAALTPYGRSIPTRFATSFRLDLLPKAAAIEAIREPACEAGVEFEQAGVEELERSLSLVRVQQPDGTVTEVPGDYVEPVQLQVVCRRLWDTLPPAATTITAEHVKGVGQVARALADYYDDVVMAAAQQADGGERAVREWVEKALITPNGLRGEVMHTPKTSGGLDNAAIRVLVDGYLVRGDNRRGNTWYELAHDRLIEPAKSSNAQWFEKSLQPMQRQAALWEREGRPDRLLLRGWDLKEAENWAKANAALVLDVEEAFLKRSAERRSAIRAKVIAALAGSIVVLGFIGVVLFLQDALARMARVYEVTLSNETLSWTAYANSALRNGNPDQAELLALRALPDPQHVRPLSDNALSVLRDALGNDRQRAILVDHTWSKGAVKDVAVNQDGTRIATASDDQTARIFDARTGAALLLLNEHTDKVNSVAFSTNGLNVVTSSDDGTARVWNAVTGERIATLRAGGGRVRSATFGHDDSHVATAAEDGARIWDLSARPPNGQLLPGGAATAITVSPDGKYVAVVAEDFVVRLFTIGGTGVQVLSGPTMRINTASFSPNSQRIVAASDDGFAWVWSINNPHPEIVLRGHEGRVLDANFSGDGSRIVTAASDATARIFDSTSAEPIRQLEGHRGGISVARFSPDPQERWIVTASDDQTAALWDPSEVTVMLRGHRLKINAAVFTMDGERLVTASDDGTVRVWDARPPSAMPLLSTLPLTEPDDQIAFARFAAIRDPQSPDEDQVPAKVAPLKIQQSSGPCARMETEPRDPRDVTPGANQHPPPPTPDDIVACRADAHRTNDPYLLYQLGMGLETSGARAEAVAQYEAAAKLGSGAAYFRLALISFAQKGSSDGQRAVQYLQQGAQAGDAYCHRRLAELYESATQGAADLGQALLHYIIALRLFDSEADIRNARYRAASIARNLPPQDVVKIGRQAENSPVVRPPPRPR